MVELARLREFISSEFMPSSGWNEPFPESVAARVKLENGTPLTGLDYNEGLHEVLLELGWDSP